MLLRAYGVSDATRTRDLLERTVFELYEQPSQFSSEELNPSRQGRSPVQAGNSSSIIGNREMAIFFVGFHRLDLATQHTPANVKHGVLQVQVGDP